MIYFQIADELPAEEITAIQGKLRSAVEEVLKYSNTSPSSELCLVLTDNDYIRQLNHQYLGIDQPTDVLSFPLNEVDPESGNPYLGDVLIAYPYALKQAKEHRHAVVDEMQLLVVHGVLHLLGHDHAQEADRSRMWAAQAEILNRLGCSDDLTPK